MTHAYYNEIEPYCAEWLANLSREGHIARGVVDARDIRAVGALDLSGSRQAHFFAGIGVWSCALKLAGWPDDVPVWTGSCPCQPFSQAGRRKGNSDDRHLWPEWRRLIAECLPPIVFGEQVASPDGRKWLDAVRSDLEALGYAVGAADLCAASVGAPHIRQRLFVVGIRTAGEFGVGVRGRQILGRGTRGREASFDGLALADVQRREGLGVQLQSGEPRQASAEARGSGALGFVADSDRDQRGPGWTGQANGDGAEQSAGCGEARELGHARGAGSGRDPGAVPGEETQGRGTGFSPGSVSDLPVAPGATRGFWAGAEWIPCQDGVYRPVEPGTFPLVDGAVGRVGKLRAYGNAIVPQVAATFIRAVMETLAASPS